MMWVLAAVVVVVLGCAAIVGSGRWGSMPELVDDRPGQLPPPGEVRADDLRQATFAVVTRGYSMTQVDALLERVARQLEAGDQHPGPTREYLLENDSEGVGGRPDRWHEDSLTQPDEGASPVAPRA